MRAELLTERFLIKSLEPGVDKFNSYLNWMRNVKLNQFIQSADQNYSMQSLVQYVTEKNVSQSALLLGIFVRLTGTHIGNVKLEPIISKKSATLGILIGEESWRGQGVGFEVITRVLEFCFIDLELKFVELGVDKKNQRAIDLYTRIGFKESLQDHKYSESIRMSISKRQSD